VDTAAEPALSTGDMAVMSEEPQQASGASPAPFSVA
jgi:hypothetical protein